jgi:hypothetical protein
VLTKTIDAVKVATNTKGKQSAKGSVQLLEALKKARKEKGGK